MKKVISFLLCFALMVAVFPVNQLVYADYTMLFPVKNGKLAYYYGYSASYGGNHTGIDIHSKGNDNIYAAASGKVVAVANSCPHVSIYPTKCEHYNTFGNYIKIQHADGTYAYYGHLKQNSLKVSVGEQVSKGQIIASMGSSGYSSGKHLHFEMRLSNGSTKINVNPVAEGGTVVYEYSGYSDDVQLNYATISEGVYYLRNFYTNDYLAVADGKDVNAQDVRTFGFYPSTAYQFEVKQSTTTSGYALRPLCSSSRMLNVYADNVVSGKNVCIYNDTGDGTQRWYFEETTDGHILRVVQNPSCVLDVLDDHNVAVYTAHGGASQTWVLENSISYDANGGEGAPAMQMKTYGNSATLSATIPTRSGYTFLGWATSPTATAAAYTVGGTFTANANTVLYAVWSKNTSTPMPPASTMCGDVDNSGKVDSTDARLVLQYVVKKITASSLNLTAAEVDSDGVVNSTDARLILQYCVKKIDRLPVSKTENGGKDDTDKVDTAIESGKIYTLTNLASNKLLNVYGNKSANNTNVTIYDNDNTAGQYFQCVKNGDAYVLVPQCATGSALNVYGESAANNANVCIWEKTGHNTQAWELEYNSSANAYVLHSASNTDFVLAATGKANSDNVCLKTYAAGDTYQLWQFTEVKSSAESNDNALYSPVVSRRITSNFQPYYRQDYSNQWAHVGIDYVSSTSDSTIYAFYGGTVSRVAYNASTGNYVELCHTYNGKTFYSYYFHLQANSIRVSQGDTVVGGQPIATMGNTGDVTGVHLHFQITSSSVVNANGSFHTPQNQSSYSGWSVERQAAEKSFTSTRGVVFYNPEKVLTQGLSIIG